MPAFVIDCSVAIAWLTPDEFFDSHLLDQVIEKGAIVPYLLSLEVGNVILIAERQKRISSGQHHKVLYTLIELPMGVDSMTSQHAWLEAMDLAEKSGLTLYDASYLGLSLLHSLLLAAFDIALKRVAEEVEAYIPALYGIR